MLFYPLNDGHGTIQQRNLGFKHRCPLIGVDASRLGHQCDMSAFIISQTPYAQVHHRAGVVPKRLHVSRRATAGVVSELLGEQCGAVVRCQRGGDASGCVTVVGLGKGGGWGTQIEGGGQFALLAPNPFTLAKQVPGSVRKRAGARHLTSKSAAELSSAASAECH